MAKPTSDSYSHGCYSITVLVLFSVGHPICYLFITFWKKMNDFGFCLKHFALIKALFCRHSLHHFFARSKQALLEMCQKNSLIEVLSISFKFGSITSFWNKCSAPSQWEPMEIEIPNKNQILVSKGLNVNPDDKSIPTFKGALYWSFFKNNFWCRLELYYDKWVDR